jgi:predicted AAA+ superfamily ATPase
MHPLSLAEVDPHFGASSVPDLLRFGGFPEPFFAQSEKSWKRWQLERSRQVLRDDLRDLERVEEVMLVSLLAERLPALVGSPLSINALKQDLQVGHATVKNWLQILERLFVLFRIAPFGSPKIRAVKKEMKGYMWDWSLVEENGPRFENMVASQLLKYCHFLENTEGERMELRYIRDTDKREIDFVVLKAGLPLFAVECKVSVKDVLSEIGYFSQRLNIPKYYLVHLGDKDYEHAILPLRVLPFHKFVSELGLP